MDRGRVSPAVEVSLQNQDIQQNEEESTIQIEPLLKPNATNQEILNAMKHPVTGVGFIAAHENLPPLTFISADAVNWLMIHMEGISNIERATQKMQCLQREQLIRHASGDHKKEFVYGFYLYYVMQDNKDGFQPIGDLQAFENEWLEVEIRPPLNWGLTASATALNVPNANLEREQGVPHFFCEEIDLTYLQSDLDPDCPLYKRIHLETDTGQRSDRIEWGHARYQTVFRPDQAYELVVEWLTSSGSIIAELLNFWSRKAQICGLQMIPIPHDPLALPYSNKSDPLRGPIFIPLNTKCLAEKERLFKEFREDTALERLFLFQEAIVARFGFIPCLVEPSGTGGSVQEHQYIHATGTIFVLVSSPAPGPRNRQTSITDRSAGRYSVHADVVPSPHEAYITRHVSGKNKDNYDNSRRVGFLWSWNHMVSKRWRTNQAVDTNFQTRLLKDFREFCSNTDDRLRNYWEESWLAKECARASTVAV